MVRRPLREDDVLDRYGDSAQAARVFAARQFLVHPPGGFESALAAEVQIRVRLRVLGLGEAQSFLGEFHGAELLFRKTLAYARDRQAGNIHAYQSPWGL